MLKRWRKQVVETVKFDDLLDRIREIGQNHPSIVFTPDNTEANWLGVKNATLGMFPTQTVVLPQNYSNSLLSLEQQEKLIKEFQSLGGKLIIFSGLPSYVYDWIELIHAEGLETGVIYHGGLAELTNNPQRQKQMARLIQLANKGVIQRIGVVKNGLNKWFEQQSNAKTYKVIPALNIPKNLRTKPYNDQKTHIGIFGNSTYNKNRHTQVVAASMIENSIIHILAPNEFEYALPPERIVTHENLDRQQFLELLGSMDINLYCSYSESWGQVILESLALGIPCFASNNSGILDFDPNLSQKLYVNEYDNPYKIFQKINDYSSEPLQELSLKINDIADRLNQDFVMLS